MKDTIVLILLISNQYLNISKMILNKINSNKIDFIKKVQIHKI